MSIEYAKLVNPLRGVRSPCSVPHRSNNRLHRRHTAAAAGSALILLLLLSQSAGAGLVNPGFELPANPATTVTQVVPGDVPGWDTDEATIEVWSNNFNGVPAYEGNQHAEVNGQSEGTLFQDVTGIAAGQRVGFEFAHRGRFGTDTLRLTITDLGAGGTIGGGDDTVLFTKEYSAGNAAWVFNTNAGEAPIVTLGNAMRFAYEAVSTANGDPTNGNFLDAADFGLDVGEVVPVPAPASAVLLLTGLFGLGALTRRRANA